MYASCDSVVSNSEYTSVLQKFITHVCHGSITSLIYPQFEANVQKLPTVIEIHDAPHAFMYFSERFWDIDYAWVQLFVICLSSWVHTVLLNLKIGSKNLIIYD